MNLKDILKSGVMSSVLLLGSCGIGNGYEKNHETRQELDILDFPHVVEKGFYRNMRYSIQREGEKINLEFMADPSGDLPRGATSLPGWLRTSYEVGTGDFGKMEVNGFNFRYDSEMEKEFKRIIKKHYDVEF